METYILSFCVRVWQFRCIIYTSCGRIGFSLVVAPAKYPKVPSKSKNVTREKSKCLGIAYLNAQGSQAESR